MSAAEAARIMQVSRQFIHTQAQQGVFETAHRVSPTEASKGLLVFRREEVEDLAKQRAAR